MSIPGEPRSRSGQAQRRATSPVERWLSVVLVTALFAPLVTTLGLEIGHRDARTHPISDLAIIDMAAREASSLDRARGPYSRHGWSHPGPLYFYVLATGLWAAGDGPLTLPLVVLILGALSLFVAVLVGLQEHGRRRSQFVGWLALALLLAALQGTFAPSAFTGRWNPIAPLLPYLALWVLLPGLARGHWRRLVAVVLLHALVSQTHVAFVLPSTVGVLLATALGLRQKRPSTRVALAAATVLILVWLPILAAPENLADLSRFFQTGGGSRPAGFSPLGLAAAQTQACLLQLLPESFQAAAIPLLLVQVVALVWAAARATRAGPSAGQAGLLLGAVHLTVAVLACFFVDHVGAAHSTLFATVAGALGWAELGMLAASRASPAAARPIQVIATLSAVVALGISCARLPSAYTAWAAQRRVDNAVVASLLDGARSASRASEGLEPSRPVVTVARWANERSEHEYWTWLAALRLALFDEGERPASDPAFEFMFWGPGPYERPGRDRLVLGPPGFGDRPVLGGAGPVRIYGPTVAPPRSPPPSPQPIPLRAGTSRGVGGVQIGSVADGALDPPWTFLHRGARVRLHSPLARWVDVAIDTDPGHTFELEADCGAQRSGGRASLRDDGGPVQIEPAYAAACEATLVLTETRAGETAVIRSISMRGVAPAMAVVTVPEALDAAEVLVRFPPDDAVLDEVPWAVCLDAPGDNIVLRSPPFPLARLEVSATANAQLEIESRVDGQWVRVSSVEAAGPGPRGETRFTTRTAYVEPGLPTHEIRLRPRQGREGCVAYVHPVAGPGLVVPLSAGADAFSSGWSGVERDGDRAWRWTLGRDATVVLSALPAGDYTLLARIGTHNGSHPQGLSIGTSGRFSRDTELRSGMHLYRFPLRLDGTETELVLRARWASAPSSGDPRTLGVSLGYLAVVPQAAHSPDP